MNAKSIFCINTHYLYTNLRIHHGSIYAHYRKVGINYRSIGTISCDWTKNVMSCVSCFCRKLKFLFDSRPFCNFDSAYSLFCHKKPVTILLSWKVFPSTPRISLFRPYCYFFAAERKSQLCSIYFITRVMLYNATPIAVQFRKPFRIYIRI